MKPSINVVLVSLLLLIDVISVCHGGGGGRGGGLSPVFYDKSCPQIERIVRNITWSMVAENSTMAPKLLRMHYHDCFVRVRMYEHKFLSIAVYQPHVHGSIFKKALRHTLITLIRIYMYTHIHVIRL